VSKLLTDATASNLVSVGEFLAYINNLRDSGSREGEARSTAEGVVQLMSIHAAKGLEFPVMALGDIGYETSFRNSVLLDPRLGVLLPQKDEAKTLAGSYTLARLQAQDQEEAESRRLLYVAITRAQEKVLLSGCLSLKRDGTPGRSGRSWLGVLAEPDILGLSQQSIPYNPAGANIVELSLQVSETPVSCHIYEPGCEPKRSARVADPEPDWPTPLPPAFLTPLTTPKPVVAEPPQRVWRVMPDAAPAAPAWVVGDLVHKALAAWRFSGPGFEEWLATQARNFGLTDEAQIKDAVDQSRRLLAGFQNHFLYQVMNQSPRRLHQVPYSLLRNGIVEIGSLDALFLQGNVWTVVEFNTDRIQNEAERDFVLSSTAYFTQIQRYRQIVKQMLNQEPEVILCWLNYAGQVQLQTDFAVSVT
jgi:ATP-dependent exoDNAse (exonuclease V) beta subunit